MNRDKTLSTSINLLLGTIMVAAVVVICLTLTTHYRVKERIQFVKESSTTDRAFHDCVAKKIGVVNVASLKQLEDCKKETSQ